MSTQHNLETRSGRVSAALRALMVLYGDGESGQNMAFESVGTSWNTLGIFQLIENEGLQELSALENEELQRIGRLLSAELDGFVSSLRAIGKTHVAIYRELNEDSDYDTQLMNRVWLYRDVLVELFGGGVEAQQKVQELIKVNEKEVNWEILALHRLKHKEGESLEPHEREEFVRIEEILKPQFEGLVKRFKREFSR